MDERAAARRILIADDHPILREGLRSVLEARTGFQVVGEATDGEEAVDLAVRLKPDILLLDLAMPRLSGLEVLERLAQVARSVRTIVFTAAIDRWETVEALRLGARGIILKGCGSELLFAGLRAVVAGEYWLGREAVRDMVDGLDHLARSSNTPAPMTQLTPRELEIVRAVLDGASNRDIGARLGVSEQTVKNHLSHIFDKLGVSSRLELALFAFHHREIRDQLGR